MTLPISGPISMLDVWKEINEIDYYFETREDFDARIDKILAENNNDLSTKTLYFSDKVTDLSYGFGDKSGLNKKNIISTPKKIIGKNITTVKGLFENCDSLEDISETLFFECPNIVDFSDCFYSTCFLSIPENLFSKNIKAINFHNCLSNSLKVSGEIVVPEKLFWNNINATDFSSCFSMNPHIWSLPEKLFWNNINVTDFNDCFSYCAGLDIIPENLFVNNIKVINFSGCFMGCEYLTIPTKIFHNNINALDFSYCFAYIGHSSYPFIIPEDLFINNIKATDFSGCFIQCFHGDGSYVKESIPAGLFRNNKEAKKFKNCFSSGEAANMEIPYNIFDNCNKVEDFSECFSSMDVISKLPDAWNKEKFPNVTNGTDYAYDCINAANYSEIPSNFGGPAENPEVPNKDPGSIKPDPVDPPEVEMIDPRTCDYYFEDGLDFEARISQILIDNNDDLSQKTIGFSDSFTSLVTVFGDGCGTCEPTTIKRTPKYIVAKNVTTVLEMFSGTKLEFISETLFKYLPNLVDASWCFRGAITEKCEIPEKLFYYNKKIENLSYCFAGIGVATLPNKLFCNLVNLTDVSNCFEESDLKYIPEDLFENNYNLKNITSCFVYSKSLRNIPSNLFKNNKQITDFSDCFSLCDSLTAVPFDLFDNHKNATDFYGVFEDSFSINSSLPDVWNKKKFPNVTDSRYYAKGCTKAINYKEIPAEFGGDATTMQEYINRKLNNNILPDNPISLGDDNVRKLAGINSGTIKLSDFYGKEMLHTAPQECDYYFETIEDFNNRRDQILAENNNNLSQKSLGFGDGVIDLSGAFKTTEITHTPKMIVSRNCTSIKECFDGCTQLVHLSGQLFSCCPNIENASNCFSYCDSIRNVPKLFYNNTKITDFTQCFAMSGVSSIAPYLFDKNVNVTTFEYCFGDTSLSFIPDNLFKNNTKVVNFNYCFGGTSIRTIPSNIFDTNKEVKDFSYCFTGCRKLEIVPKNIFESSRLTVNNFDDCFNGCTEIITTLPDVWNKDKFPNVTNAFHYAYNCTKAKNYNEIPDGFK